MRRLTSIASGSTKTLVRRALFGAVACLGLNATTLPALSEPSVAKISAVYKLRFAGMKLGNFNLAAKVVDGQYKLRGSSKITFLTGILFELTGATASSGRLAAADPRPAAFSFNFKTKKSNGRLVMQFRDGGVSQVASQPPLRSSNRVVPVTDKHVKGVLDPLTALFMTAKAAKPGHHASVCDRRLPVYDGLYRFDLQLSHKKTVRVVKKRKSGYGGPAVICKVKFIPVAGHKPHASQIAFMSRTDDIEIWLMPLPEDDHYVPYHISLPTPYGTAQMTSTALQVVTASRKKFALVQ